MAKTNNNDVALSVLFQNGTLTGAQFIQKTGMSKDDARVALHELMSQGLVGRDGEGPNTIFGLSDAGMALFEQAPAQGEDLTVEEDEFSQAPAPARRAPARATQQAQAPAQRQAPATRGGKGAAARPAAAQAPAQRQAPARPAAAPAKPAPARATPAAPAPAKAEAVQRPVKYSRIDHLSGADWQYRVDVGTEMAWRIVENADINAYLSELGEEGQNIVAELLMRSVSKAEGLIAKYGADAAAGAKR